MKTTLRLLTLVLAIGLSAIAFGQPLPPYQLSISGILTDCSPTSYVNIQTVQGTIPELNLDVLVNANCEFSIELEMESFNGWIQFSIPCGEVLENITTQTYEMNAFGVQSMVVALSCGSPVDCMGVINGPDVPGAPCDDNDPNTLNDTLSEDCQCVGGIPGECTAEFMVIQAYTWVEDNTPNGGEVEPIPNELWVWNLSSGGDGNYQFVWNFGDGTSSTEPFPTHVYAQTGPYTLCLTMTDGSGCSDTYCQDVSVDEGGLISGMILQEETFGLRTGFTITVLSEQPVTIAELSSTPSLTLWPNPVEDIIGLSFGTTAISGLSLTIYDQSGRAVLTSGSAAQTAKSSFQLDVSNLSPGVYVIRIGTETNGTTRRFVKR